MPDDLRIRSDMGRLLHAVLRHWRNEERSHKLLSELLLYRPAVRAAGGPQHAARYLLEQALAELGKLHPSDAQLLEMRYWDGLGVEQVANLYGYAESTIYGRQSLAFERLSALVEDREQNAWRNRERHVEHRMQVPYSDKLVGVEHEISTIGALLSAPTGPWIVALEGIGGIGKTTLAAQLVRRLYARTDFEDFAWVSAQPRALDVAGCIQGKPCPTLSAQGLVDSLVTQLMPDTAGALLAAPEKALQALEERLKWAPHLIIIDNLETVADIDALMPKIEGLINPSKFLLTSRRRVTQHAVFNHTMRELTFQEACTLVRSEAALRNLQALVVASDDDLAPIYETVGGNPLALLLITGQTYLRPLRSIIADLREAKGVAIDNLYTFIYRDAWEHLSESARRVLLAMPLAPVQGEGPEYLATICELATPEVVSALRDLTTQSLVQVYGDLNQRRFKIHSLTRTFLLQQVLAWT
ncbi:MAG: hypothetical protein IPK16_20930 [Anaerolineales bacterium]|nr:hypothetical protein [Anaerolineales bacterium]